MADDLTGIVRARQAAGLSQAEAGRRAGMSASHWADVERGRGSPRLSTLARMASALGIDVSSILRPQP